jgi:hypothetical protein
MNPFICYAKGLNRSGYLLVRFFNLIHSTARCMSKVVLLCLRSLTTSKLLPGEIHVIRELQQVELTRINGNFAESASYTEGDECFDFNSS